MNIVYGYIAIAMITYVALSEGFNWIVDPKTGAYSKGVEASLMTASVLWPVFLPLAIMVKALGLLFGGK